MRRFSPYNFAFDNPLPFVDRDGMAPNDVILQVNRNRNQDGTYSYTATATINLTVVDPKQNLTSAQLEQAKEVAKNFGGTVYAKIGDNQNVAIDVKVELNLTVVTDAKKAKPTDYIIQMVKDIPSAIGLRSGARDAGAVESSAKPSSLGTIITHELGHVLYS